MNGLKTHIYDKKNNNFDVEENKGPSKEEQNELKGKLEEEKNITRNEQKEQAEGLKILLTNINREEILNAEVFLKDLKVIYKKETETRFEESWEVYTGMDYKGAKDLLEYIFGKEEYLKLFISDYKYKIDYEIKTDYKKKEQIEDMLKKEFNLLGERNIFDFVKCQAFFPDILPRGSSVYDALHRYANAYFETKYALELLKQSKHILKDCLPNIFKDINVVFDTRSHIDHSYTNSSGNTIGLRFYEKYNGLTEFPKEEKITDLMIILHEYTHGIFHDIVNPKYMYNIRDMKYDFSIIKAIDEGFTLLIENIIYQEIKNNPGKFNFNNSDTKYLEKRTQEINQKRGNGRISSKYKDLNPIFSQLYEKDGIDGVIKFIESIDLEKALPINENNIHYREALSTNNPNELLKIIGKNENK